jgi:hypothetical protein
MRTGGGVRLLRSNLRRRQNRDCDNQAKTSSGAMHDLFSRQLSAWQNDDRCNFAWTSWQDLPVNGSAQGTQLFQITWQLFAFGYSTVR